MKDLNERKSCAHARRLVCLGQEGPRGFFRGNGVDVLRGIPATGLGYLSYEYFKLALRQVFPAQTSKAYDVGVRLVAGGTPSKYHRR